METLGRGEGFSELSWRWERPQTPAGMVHTWGGCSLERLGREVSGNAELWEQEGHLGSPRCGTKGGHASSLYSLIDVKQDTFPLE